MWWLSPPMPQIPACHLTFSVRHRAVSLVLTVWPQCHTRQPVWVRRTKHDFFCTRLAFRVRVVPLGRDGVTLVNEEQVLLAGEDHPRRRGKHQLAHSRRFGRLHHVVGPHHVDGEEAVVRSVPAEVERDDGGGVKHCMDGPRSLKGSCHARAGRHIAHRVREAHVLAKTVAVFARFYLNRVVEHSRGLVLRDDITRVDRVPPLEHVSHEVPASEPARSGDQNALHSPSPSGEPWQSLHCRSAMASSTKVFRSTGAAGIDTATYRARVKNLTCGAQVVVDDDGFVELQEDCCCGGCACSSGGKAASTRFSAKDIQHMEVGKVFKTRGWIWSPCCCDCGRGIKFCVESPSVITLRVSGASMPREMMYGISSTNYSEIVDALREAGMPASATAEPEAVPFEHNASGAPKFDPETDPGAGHIDPIREDD
jgi:hypothetical protein